MLLHGSGIGKPQIVRAWIANGSSCGESGHAASVRREDGMATHLLVGKSDVRSIDATGLPLGIFCSEEFSVAKAQLGRGDLLMLFTDGLSEAQNLSGAELGVQPLIDLAETRLAASAHELVSLCMARAAEFREGAPSRDDLSVMVIERVG
jgi:serine phosphatase RsbU (regulator of sigma subunit)